MSEFQRDLIKILLDKGLLALLILLFGFILNRAVERYKARSAYYQKLSEARILAYQEVVRILAAELMLLEDLRQNLIESYKTSPHQEALEFARKCYKDFFVSYRETSPNMAKHSIFFSRSLSKALNQHYDKVQEFWRVSWPTKEGTLLAAKRSEDMACDLSKGYTEIIRMLQEEVKTAPSV